MARMERFLGLRRLYLEELSQFSILPSSVEDLLTLKSRYQSSAMDMIDLVCAQGFGPGTLDEFLRHTSDL